MSKHAIPTIWPTVEKQGPAHSKGWTPIGQHDDRMGRFTRETSGAHAKPFAAHHPARPVTYDAQGTVTPLTPTAHVLDVVA